MKALCHFLAGADTNVSQSPKRSKAQSMASASCAYGSSFSSCPLAGLADFARIYIEPHAHI